MELQTPNYLVVIEDANGDTTTLSSHPTLKRAELAADDARDWSYAEKASVRIINA